MEQLDNKNILHGLDENAFIEGRLTADGQHEGKQNLHLPFTMYFQPYALHSAPVPCPSTLFIYLYRVHVHVQGDQQGDGQEGKIAIAICLHVGHVLCWSP